MLLGGRHNTITGLDIGTTKICVLVAQVKEKGLEIIGTGIAPSDGLRKGVVIDMESTVTSVRRALDEAERSAGTKVHSVITGIAGGHIRSYNTTASVTLKSGEVREEDIKRVLELASSVPVPVEREVVHTVVQEYTLDEQRGIKNPMGMSGNTLHVNLHVVTAAVASAQNLIKAANMAGVDVDDIVLQPLASAEAVLHHGEKDLGTALVDFGGGTTDMAVYYGGTVRYTSVLPLGGDNLTYDLAIGLRISRQEAEALKKTHGFCHRECGDLEEGVELKTNTGWNERVVSKGQILAILEPRVKEIFTLLKEETVEQHVNQLINMGLVITGGSSLLPGMLKRGSEVFGVPTRLGYPKGIERGMESIASPVYATAVGLIIYGSRRLRGKKMFRRNQGNIFYKVLRRMRKWFSNA